MQLTVQDYRNKITYTTLRKIERTEMGHPMKLRARWFFGLVSLAAAIVVNESAFGADEPEKPAGPFVVIVGVGQFQDKAIDVRPTADADAKGLYDLFTDPKYFGVPAGRARLLLSAPDEKRHAQIATRGTIIKAIETATAQTRMDDLLVIAFFGRGASSGNNTVFLTPDATLKDRAKTGLVFGNDLETAFQNVKRQKVLLLMDVEYKGFRPGDEKIAEPTLTDLETLLFGSADMAESVRPHDRLMLLSGFVGAEPVARNENGLFAAALFDGLKGAADATPNCEGYEPDGVVTVDELLKYLDKEIPARARAINKAKAAQAVPVGSLTSHFAVTHNPTETDKVKKRLDALTVLAKNGTIDEETAKEGTALIARMPKLKANQELRKKYQELADGSLKPAGFLASRKEIKDGLKFDAKDAERYAKNVNDAIDLVRKLYVRELDSVNLTAAAIKGMYRRIEEPLPDDLAEALKATKVSSDSSGAELLRDIRLRLGKREDLDENKDAELSIQMMIASLNDPYSVYFDKAAAQKMNAALRGRFPGVGMQVRRDAVRDALLVVSPIKGSPAFDAGIRAGDLIVAIRREVDNATGAPLPDGVQRVLSTKGMTTDKAVSLVVGKPGSAITLVIDRDGKEMTFPLKRNWVNVETVLGVKRNAGADWNYLLDPKYRIGYVRLTQFTQSTAGDLKVAIEELKTKGLNGLVLDLRGNPGGSLVAATFVCEMFVGREKLVTIRPREGGGAGQARTARGERPGDKSFEMVVLINGHSASASEIVAACLQDHERAVIMGERSYGKGSVQDVIKFKGTDGEIKLTIARYYPPSNRNIDKGATKGEPTETWGVKPNKGHEIKLTGEESNDLEAHMRAIEVIPPPGKKLLEVTEEKDKQLKAAMDYLRTTLDENRKGANKK